MTPVETSELRNVRRLCRLLRTLPVIDCDLGITPVAYETFRAMGGETETSRYIPAVEGLLGFWMHDINCGPTVKVTLYLDDYVGALADVQYAASVLGEPLSWVAYDRWSRGEADDSGGGVAPERLVEAFGSWEAVLKQAGVS